MESVYHQQEKLIKDINPLKSVCIYIVFLFMISFFYNSVTFVILVLLSISVISLINIFHCLYALLENHLILFSWVFIKCNEAWLYHEFIHQFALNQIYKLVLLKRKFQIFVYVVLFCILRAWHTSWCIIAIQEIFVE